MIHAGMARTCVPLVMTFVVASPWDALGERMARYRSSVGIEARIQALEQVAALGGADAALEPEALCRALAEGLADELPKVRARAVALVAAAGPPAVAAEALLAATEAQVALEREIMERTSDFEPFNLEDMFSKSKRRREGALDDLDRQIDASTELIAWLDLHVDIPFVRDALALAWPSVRDDRAVVGLAALLDSAEIGAGADPLVTGLLSIGTSPALEALAAQVVRYEAVRKKSDARGRELARMRPGKNPTPFVSDEQWEKGEKERIASRREKHELAVAAQEAWMESFAERVREFGKANGLDPAPRALKPARSWAIWAAKAREVLPASLPGD